ncbi:MAG: hypothetical protein K6T17_07130, partial [Fimbriimonadales bacterium]|nr:hypothetical protein [Fimbriimonadales bacterium]
GIPNSELQLEQIPNPDGSYFDFEQFARTFNGYVWAKRTLRKYLAYPTFGEFANSVRRNWVLNKTFPQTLSELRACLFFESRRVHFAEGDDPSEDTIDYCRALIQAIREKVMRNERD